jgi:hypothetical protein
MALDKLTLLDENIINTAATNIATSISTTVATDIVNNSVQNNYIAFPVATANPLSNGWRIYNDGASVAPVDGASGTTTISLSQNTVSPLYSSGDFRLTKTSGASRQGEGISTDFTIANRHLAKVLQGSFDYELISGTLTTNDIRFYIIQDPGGANTVIEPVNVSLQGTTIGNRVRHLATFQTSPTITNYRLCIHIATTTNSNQIIDFNGFKIWEHTQSIGSIITDWVSYTPSTTRANTTNRSFYYRRVGGGIQISFGWQYTSGVSSSSTALMTDIFPPGLTLDLSRIAPANGSGAYLRYNIGHYFSNDYGVSNHTGTIAWDTNQDPDQLAFFGGSPNSADDNLSGFIECPIIGWGSSVAMSSDSGDGRVVAVKYNNTTNGATTSTTQPMFWGTKEYDTHNAVTIGTAGSTYASGSAWKFTAPINGYYRVTISCATSSSPGGIAVWINNSKISYLTYVAASNGSGTFQLNAGDILDIRTDLSVTTDSGTTRFISIDRISAGSQVIGTNETVACRYEKTDGANVLSSATDMIYNVRTRDTHGAYNTTNGEYTVPISGYYQINCIVGLSGGSLYNIHVLKNGSVTDFTTTGGVTTMNRRDLSTGNYYLAGDKIKIQALADTTRSTDTQTGANTLFICRLGI